MLASGLPEQIESDELLTRFLASSSLFSANGIKPSAFLPSPKSRDTSVFRKVESIEEMRRIWNDHLAGAGRNLHAAAQFPAELPISIGLKVEPQEPPPKHANIANWPWLDSDLELQKARQKHFAAILAQGANLVRL